MTTSPILPNTVLPNTVHPEPMTARDLRGYGEVTPDPRWPDGAVIAVNLNLNLEAGGEHTLAHGDDASEGILNDIGTPARPGLRVPLVESVFEYGPRRGVWRILELVRGHEIPMSVFAVGRAVEQYPELFRTLATEGHEIVCHHWRWKDYGGVPEAEERADIDHALAVIEAEAGVRPIGMMSGSPSPNTRRLAAAAGLRYDRDSLADELPWWVDAGGADPFLIVPYSYETNDNRLDGSKGLIPPSAYFEYHRDAFDVLRAEGLRGQPKLLSLGLHDRLLGRPGRSAGLARLLDHMRQFDDVWFCTGADVYEHWATTFPPRR